jgi:hypothetical protein
MLEKIKFKFSDPFQIHPRSVFWRAKYFNCVFSICYLFFIATVVLSTMISCGNADASIGRVVTIDGVHIVTVLNPDFEPDFTSYLKESVDDYWRGLIEERVGSISSFAWSRRVEDTAVYVQILSAYLLQISNDNKVTNAPLVVYAHSWGTVIAYEALKQNSNIIVDKLITMGSPLNAQSETIRSFTLAELASIGLQQVEPLSNVKVWHNYWASCDPISGSIPVADQNYTISTNFDDYNWLFTGTCHGAYYDLDYGEYSKPLMDIWV